MFIIGKFNQVSSISKDPSLSPRSRYAFTTKSSLSPLILMKLKFLLLYAKIERSEATMLSPLASHAHAFASFFFFNYYLCHYGVLNYHDRLNHTLQ